LDASVVAQPGGDHPRVGVFECDAAHGVDDLAAASSSCLKMIVAPLMLVCSVVKYTGLRGLSCRCGGNDFVPDREAGGHLGSPVRPEGLVVDHVGG
ncbi:hypothetical protein, partial [Mycobacterium sp.]|uniref:hypothetical protein n=1 Tax=Mycobacterium sp. TaxID=1785 RepID=UPI002CD8F21A